MKRPAIKPQIARMIMIAILAFNCAWFTWLSLAATGWNFNERGKIIDLLIPAMYGLVAITGSVVLFILAARRKQIRWVRIALLLSGIALLVMPFLFYKVKSPAFTAIVIVLNWTISLITVALMFYLSASTAFNRRQRITVFIAAIAALLAPFMPWGAMIYQQEPLPEFIRRIVYLYGAWIVVILWALAAISLGEKLPEREFIRRARQNILNMLIIGLSLFMVGVLNPVAMSGKMGMFEVKTYIGGTLINTETVSAPTGPMNWVVAIGAGITCLAILFILLLKEPKRRVV